MNPGLADEKCIPCAGGVPRLRAEEIAALTPHLPSGWRVEQVHHLEKEFRFKDFREALRFTQRVGAMAEQEGHHPEITLAWGRVVVRSWTHKAGGLTRADFVLAAKTDRIFEGGMEEDGG